MHRLTRRQGDPPLTLEDIQAALDCRYVQRGYCAESTRILTDKVDSLQGSFDAIAEKLNRMTWISAVIGVAVVCIAGKVLLS